MQREQEPFASDTSERSSIDYGRLLEESRVQDPVEAEIKAYGSKDEELIAQRRAVEAGGAVAEAAIAEARLTALEKEGGYFSNAEIMDAELAKDEAERRTEEAQKARAAADEAAEAAWRRHTGGSLPDEGAS